MSHIREYVGCKSIEAVNYDGKGSTIFNMWVTDEEIVRCRDCEGSIDDGISSKCETFIANGEDPNGFCKWGNRNER